MDKKNDSALYLMQDIKELLLGIGLAVISIALTALGGVALFLADSVGLTEYAALFLWLMAVIVLLCGILYVWHGFSAHKLVESESSEQ